MIFRTTTCAALALLTAGAFAQFPGANQPNAEYVPTLLFNPDVQKELHMSPELVQKEQSIFMQQAMAMLPILMKGQGKGGGAPSADSVAKGVDNKKMLQAVQTMMSKVVEPLSSAQRTRLHELTLQYIGPTALIQPKLEKELGLTSAQEGKLTDLISNSSQGIRSSLQSRGKSGLGANVLNQMSQAQMQARATEEQKLPSILSHAQLAKWKAMQGKPLPSVLDNSKMLSGLMGGMGH